MSEKYIIKNSFQDLDNSKLNHNICTSYNSFFLFRLYIIIELLY